MVKPKENRVRITRWPNPKRSEEKTVAGQSKENSRWPKPERMSRKTPRDGRSQRDQRQNQSMDRAKENRDESLDEQEPKRRESRSHPKVSCLHEARNSLDGQSQRK